MANDLATKVLYEVRKAVVGKDDVVAKALLAILAGGHILMEDIPGVGKSTLAVAFSNISISRSSSDRSSPQLMQTSARYGTWMSMPRTFRFRVRLTDAKLLTRPQASQNAISDSSSFLWL